MVALEQIAGTVVKVDTKYLFKDQFSTVELPGISENGLRLMAADVEEVLNDQRHKWKRCNWCGEKTPVECTCCHKCLTTNFFEELV